MIHKDALWGILRKPIVRCNRSFIRWYLPVVFLICGMSILFAKILIDSEKHKLESPQIELLSQIKGELDEQLDTSIHHLRSLATYEPLIQAALNHPEIPDKATIASQFETSLLRNPNYSKIRWINEQGKEQLVVIRDYDFSTRILNQSDLQDLSGTQYVKKSLELQPNEVYISSIETDRKNSIPSIRMAIRVYQKDRNPYGIFLVNIREDKWINRVAKISGDQPIYILTDNGYELSSPDSKGQLILRPKNFALENPELWAVIQTEAHGQWESASGFWAWTSISLTHLAEHSSVSWKVLTSISPQTMDRVERKIGFMVGGSAMVLLLISGGSLWIHSQNWENQRRLEQELRQRSQSLEELNQRLEYEIIDHNLAREQLIESLDHLNKIYKDLQKSEMLLHEIVDSAPYGMIVYDQNQEALVFNENFVRILDLPAELVQKQPLRFRDQVSYCYDRGDYGHEMTCEDIITYYTAFMKSHKTVRTQRLQSNGTWIELCGKSLAGYFSLVTYFDITENKRSELLAKHFEAIVQSSDDAIISKNLQGKITSWNPGAEKIFGYTAAEAIGQPLIMLFPEDQQEEEEKLLQKLRQGESIHHFEATRLHRDGHQIFVSISLSPLRNEDGQVIGISKIARDISDRVAAEAEKQRLIQILNLAPDFIAMMDSKGQIIYKNPAVHTLLGLPPNYPLVDIRNAHPSWEAERIENNILPIVLQQGYWQGETILLRQDGQELPASQVILVHRDREGKPILFSTIMRDISIFKQQQESLARAKEQAETANQAKSAFLATMSHEIRTPLNAIIGMTYLLARTSLSAEQWEEVEAIEVSSKNLLALINDILDFSKIEAGELVIERHAFSLPELLHDLRLMFTALLAERGLVLNIQDLPPDIPHGLRGDSNRLRQMLINFLNNALKFTTEGEIGLNVVASRRDESGLYLRFQVTDTGIGIAPDTQTKLFQPFIQADSSTSRRFGGTGLGLSIVKRLANLMGGEVGVNSQPGEGSTFWLELPFDLAPEVLPFAAPDPGIPSCRIDRPQLTGLQVLVVDDSTLNLDVMRRILSQEGAIPTLCHSGAAAIDTLRAHPNGFDVILMDLQMPDLDGYETTQQIRQQHLTTAPIIALTAGATTTEQKRSMAAGMNHFLTKPIDPPKAIQVLRLAIGPTRLAEREQEAMEALGNLEDNELPAPEHPCTTPAGWPEIEGICPHKAIEVFGNDPEFFAQLLHIFIEENEALLHRVQEHFDRGELEQTQKVVHKIRGQAGNIGARPLYETATDLESALFQSFLGDESLDRTELDKLFADFETAYNTLVQAAKTWFAQQSIE